MIENKILTPGKKLLKMRKDLNLTQKDVSGDKISRNLISYIENDKISLTNDVANIICDNINRICLERGVSFSITKEFLLEDLSIQYNKVTNYYLDELSKYKNDLELMEKIIGEIDRFFNENNFFNKIHKYKLKLYLEIADIFKDNTCYFKAYVYYIKSYENCNIDSIKERISIALKLMKCCINLNKNKESLEYYQIVMIHKSSASDNEIVNALFNSAICYKRLKEYDRALNQLKIIKDDFSLEPNLYLDVELLNANLYQCKNHFSKSIELYSKILKTTKVTHIENKLVCLCSLLEIYISLNDSLNIKEYVEKALLLISSYENFNTKSYAPDIYADIGSALKTLNRLDEAKTYLFKSLEETKDCQKRTIILKSFDSLLDICNSLGDINTLNTTKNTMLEFLSLKLIEKDESVVYRLLSHYNSLGDSRTLADILSFLKNLN
ncbi:helix-turn-helix domain-containing protein [Clostridium hydrogeniformans]|uniref:helix-turn-helix domain-containing protein n=1 Tax=Clostridium hydrogeniformans TaxID=349933 RepID=UPI0004803780|nr:helix-turn-helix transcriptional regulator [Clostridium hydrogeniformans]